MSDAHDLNVIGAFVLATADRLYDNAARISESEGAAAAALGPLAHYADGATISGLATALRVSHSRAVRIADGLESAGLARRVPQPDDRRAVRLRLTAKGRRAAEKMRATRMAVLEETLAALSPGQRSELAALVSQVLLTTTEGRAGANSTCRLCDANACGHFDGRCPVTAGADAFEATRELTRA